MTLTPKTRLNENGFTLIEMMVVILIIGILLTIGARTWTSAIQKGKVTNTVRGMQEVEIGLQKFANNHTNYYPGMIAQTDLDGYPGAFVLNGLIGGSMQDNYLLEGIPEAGNIPINQDVPTINQQGDQRRPITDTLLRGNALEEGYASNLLRGGEIKMRNLGLMRMYVLDRDNIYGRSPTFEAGEIEMVQYRDFGSVNPSSTRPLILVDNSMYEEVGPGQGALQFADYLNGAFVYIPLKTPTDLHDPSFFKYVDDWVLLCYTHPVEEIEGSRASDAVGNQWVDMAYLHDGINDPDVNYLFPNLEAPLGDGDPMTLNPYELWVNNWFKLGPEAVSWSDDRYWPKDIGQF
jgi:prepilin-type N-terminal cleavage/methylation domain-containing protein